MALKIQIECHVGGATFSTKCKEEQYEAAFSEVESELKSMWPDVDVSCPRGLPPRREGGRNAHTDLVASLPAAAQL